MDQGKDVDTLFHTKWFPELWYGWNLRCAVSCNRIASYDFILVPVFLQWHPQYCTRILLSLFSTQATYFKVQSLFKTHPLLHGCLPTFESHRTWHGCLHFFWFMLASPKLSEKEWKYLTLLEKAGSASDGMSHISNSYATSTAHPRLLIPTRCYENLLVPCSFHPVLQVFCVKK